MNTDRFKFRAWDGNQMIYEYLIAGAEYYDALSISCGKEYMKVMYKVKEWKLMQSTGMKDSTGTLIYEGDIVEIRNCKDCVPFISTIVFKGMGFWFQDEDEELFVFHPDAYILTVIGNIYEAVQS